MACDGFCRSPLVVGLDSFACVCVCMHLSHAQTFDAEVLHSPPRYWYDQMGAWEVAAATRQGSAQGQGHNQVMRQVTPVWPDCWDYSCAGPTTFFGKCPPLLAACWPSAPV